MNNQTRWVFLFLGPPCRWRLLYRDRKHVADSLVSTRTIADTCCLTFAGRRKILGATLSALGTFQTNSQVTLLSYLNKYIGDDGNNKAVGVATQRMTLQISQATDKRTNRQTEGHRRRVKPPHLRAWLNPLQCKSNYSATSNNMKLIHWPLMGGLLRLVQRVGDWRGHSPPRPLFAVPNVTVHCPPITVLLYNGALWF